MDYQDNQLVNVFIASSSELKRERMELVDLMQDLNRAVFRAQGIKLKPVLWEYMDSSMRAERKEDEYLVRLRECEVCIALFWRILGEYTEEELDVSVSEQLAGRMPKRVYVLFKEPCDGILDGLAMMKQQFASRYPNTPVQTFETIAQLREQATTILTK